MGKAAEYMSRTKIGAYFHETRESRKLILVIVAVALLLDNMLLTTVGKFFFLSKMKISLCVARRGIEPVTFALLARRSNQLS